MRGVEPALVGDVAVADERRVRRDGDPDVPLDVDVRRREPPQDLRLGRVGLPYPATRDRVEQLGDRHRLVLARRPQLEVTHAGTSSSSVSGSRVEIGSSRVGSRPGRLAEPVDPDARQAELARRRDVVEEARGDVDVPAAGAASLEERLQCPCAGLYEPISEATIARSNGTPIRCQRRLE